MNDTQSNESVQLSPIDDVQRAYFLKRANDHRILALNAADPGIRSIHTRLQALYAQRAGRAGMIHCGQ